MKYAVDAVVTNVVFHRHVARETSRKNQFFKINKFEQAHFTFRLFDVI